MEEILDTTKDYPFDEISLQTPQSLQGGTYLAKIVNNDEPIIFQTPKCKTKKGIHKTGKKTYCDLLFTIDDEEFIEWIYSLEQRIQALIYEKKDYWFVDSDLTLDDIEYNWVSTVKSYKKQHLVRTFVSRNKNFSNLQVYNNEQKLVSEDNITSNSNIIGIIEITGLKFSATSFHLELAVKQVMIMKERPKFQKCLIKFKGKSDTVDEDDEEDNEDDEEDNVDNEDDEDEENVEDVEENVEYNSEKLKSDEVVEINENNEHEKDVNLVKNEDVDLVIIDTNKTSEENNEVPIKKEEETVEHKKEAILENNEVPIKKEEETVENTLVKEIANDTLVKNNDLDEVVLDLPKTQTSISLKQPNEVYLDIYKAARQKAKEAKKEAIKAYLMAKKIKQTYLLDESEISEDDSEDDFLFSEN